MSAAYDDIIKRWAHDPADEGWKDYASCRGTDPDLWFPRRDGHRRYDPAVGSRIKMAKLICLECPVQRECLEWAIAVDERWGIYGGLTEHERSKITRKRAE